MPDFLHWITQGVAAIVVLLGVLIFIHEFGHFLVAKLCGIAVEVFSFGFGPKIFGISFRGTEYRLSWIPLGGYVKMTGEDPFEEQPRNDASFMQKPVWQRFLVILAGPVFNLLLPIGVFFLVFMLGAPEYSSFVGSVDRESPAELAGIQPGDRILSVNGNPVTFAEEIRAVLDAMPLGAAVPVEVTRGSERKVFQVNLKADPGRNRNLLGVSPVSVISLVAVPEDTRWPSVGSGLKSGDLITAVNGKPVRWFFELVSELRAVAPAPVSLTFERDGDVATKTVTPKPLDELMSELGVEGLREDSLLALRYTGVPYGLFPPDLAVGDVRAGMPAAAAGLKAGDVILRMDNHYLARWADIPPAVEAAGPEGVSVTVARGGGFVTLQVRPDVVSITDPDGTERNAKQIGISATPANDADLLPMHRSVGDSLSKALSRTWDAYRMFADALTQIVTGRMPLTESLGGPISIMALAVKTARSSLFEYLSTMALLSVSLGIFNLLPIPLLDGGRILFFGVEMVRGRPVSMRFREVAEQVGLAIIFVLFVFAMSNDVRTHLFR